MKTLLAAANTFKIEKIVSTSTGITIFLTTIQSQPDCPNCATKAQKVHSRYQRQLSDLPWEGIAVRLQLNSRKWFCQNPDCEQHVFCERLPELAAPYARRTLRLNDLLTRLGFALGGRPAAQFANHLSLSASARTLLRRLRAVKQPPTLPVRVLGVDDFAFRKGQRYGTILIDQERHCVLDLLPDREAATLENWLQAHPGIEIITRDRAAAYAEGASKGAPQAQQVADRFHLLKNLVEALERLLHRHHQALKVAAQELPRIAAPTLPTGEAATTPLPPWQQRLAQEQQQRRARRHGVYQEVLRLYAGGQGMGIRAIARHLEIGRQTVRKYVRADTFPEIAARDRTTSPVVPFVPYLRQRWDAGCLNATQLWREITAQGFHGTVGQVRWCVRRWRAALPPHLRRRRTGESVRPPLVISPRQTVWWLLRPQSELESEQQQFVERLLNQNAEIASARKLALQFQQFVRQRQADHFDEWREAVAQSGLCDLKNFAAGLLQDEAAVRAALSSEWSNGRTEGHVNRLKMLKRTMFGRANFDLLRLRAIQSP